MMNSHSTRVDLHRNSHFRPVGSALLAKAAYRYGFKTVKNGFICAPKGARMSVVKMHSPGDMNGAEEMKTSEIAEDVECMMEVGVGSPAVKLMMNFDTGVADTWVWSTSAARSSMMESLKSAGETIKSKMTQGAAGTGPKETQIYDPHRSKTAHEMKHLEWKVQYGDGMCAQGHVYRDQMEIGNITVKEQDIEAAQKLTHSFMNDVRADGQMGLAFRKLNTVHEGHKPAQCNTVMDNMIKHNLIEKPIFTCNLTLMGERAFCTFGCIDKSRNESDMATCKAHTESGYWEVECPMMMVGDHKIESKSGGRAVLDTGINLILVPDEMCEKIYAQIPGAALCPERKGYVVPADANLPEFTIHFERDMRIRIDRECLMMGETGQDGKKFCAIQSCGDMQRCVLGSVFFHNAYVCFDQGNKCIGMMQKGIRA